MPVNHARRDVPPALAEWQEQEERLRREAQTWARRKLEEHFSSELGFEPKSAGEMMQILDQQNDMPSGWARVLKSDTAAYKERYAMVRNTLEVLARQKFLIMGSATNSKGVPSTVYARPRDASADWDISLKGAPGAIHKAQDALKEWLRLEGAALDGVDLVQFKRKQITAGLPPELSHKAPGAAPKHGGGRPRKRGRVTLGG